MSGFTSSYSLGCPKVGTCKFSSCYTDRQHLSSCVCTLISLSVPSPGLCGFPYLKEHPARRLRGPDFYCVPTYLTLAISSNDNCGRRGYRWEGRQGSATPQPLGSWPTRHRELLGEPRPGSQPLLSSAFLPEKTHFKCQA